MPALQVIGCGRPVGPDGRRPRGLTTRPFAADDLQLLCVLMSAYRVVQIACIVPFWIRVFLFRLHGRNVSSCGGWERYLQLCAHLVHISLRTWRGLKLCAFFVSFARGTCLG